MPRTSASVRDLDHTEISFADRPWSFRQRSARRQSSSLAPDFTVIRNTGAPADLRDKGITSDAFASPGYGSALSGEVAMEAQQSITVHREIGIDSTTLFELGMMYAAGRSRPLNLVSAHICFNLASRRGHDRASGLRREIAAEMSADEIAAAQRAARDCLSDSISEVLAAVEDVPVLHRGRRRGAELN
jgi:hypothetical protein